MAVLTWVIVVIFLLLGFIFLRAEHWGRKIKLLAIVLLCLLLYFSIMGMFTSEKIDLTSPRGIANAVYVYFGWIGRTATNLWDVGKDTVSMVGNAIRFNETEGGR